MAWLAVDEDGRECNFKDHKQDKNGNLTECTAYIE